MAQLRWEQVDQLEVSLPQQPLVEADEVRLATGMLLRRRGLDCSQTLARGAVGVEAKCYRYGWRLRLLLLIIIIIVLRSLAVFVVIVVVRHSSLLGLVHRSLDLLYVAALE